MTEAGWEQRLENLARAQELREDLVDWLWARESAIQGYKEDQYEPWLAAVRLDADALLSGPLAPLLEAQAAVQRVEAVARQMRQDGVDSYAEDRDEAATARAVALYYAADQLFAALAGPS